MRKEKSKNDSFWQASTLPFVALWAASYAAAWGVVILLFEAAASITDLSSIQANVLGIATLLLVTGMLHVQVVQRLLKQSMRGWMLYTLIGTILTLFTFTSSRGSAMGPTTMSVLSLLLPVSLVQTIWLWKRVRAAWLWPLASLAACLVFALALRGSSGQSILIWAGVLQGLVQGGVMRHLWMQPRNSEKLKVAAAEENEETLRIQRLKDNEAALLTSISDDNNTQQRGRLF